MAKKIVSLYIDDASLRLVVTHDKQVKKWADLPLEPGLVKNAVILKEAEVAAKIKQLFKVRKVKSKKVAIGVSGLHCLTRPIILPQLPKEMLEEAVRREAKRALPVPPEQLYLSWQAIAAAEGKTQVFLIAAPRKATDALFKALHRAGLKPDLMDLKPLLLARVVKEATAIIVDVQPTEFDIVIMSDGIPQPIRTLPLPDEALTWQDKLTMIKNDLARTIEFFNANNPEKTLDTSVPIFVCGELTDESELCQFLADEFKHPVSPLPSPLTCPKGLEANRYMVNMGLTLKKLSAGKESEPLVTNLNILPAAYRPEPISLTRVLSVPAIVIAVSLLFLLVALIQNASADISSFHSQLNVTDQLLQQKSAQKQKLTAKIAELQETITTTETSGGNFAAAVAKLEKKSKMFNDNLEVTVNSLSDNISLTSISHVNPSLTMKGRVPSEEEIISYLEELDASGRFSGITITSLQRTADDGMDFSLLLTAKE